MQWMELEQNHLEWDSPDPEREIWNVFLIWILPVKSTIIKLQSI